MSHYSTPGLAPTCGGCGNSRLRHLPRRTLLRKVKVLDPVDAPLILDFVAKPGAVAWTCDRCGNFGVSVLDTADEEEAARA